MKLNSRFSIVRLLFAFAAAACGAEAQSIEMATVQHKLPPIDSPHLR